MAAPMSMEQGQVPQQQFTVITGPPRPSNCLALSIMSCICCNPIFGIIAIIMANQSSSAADAGDMDEAKRKGKCALGWSLAGIIGGILCFVLIIVYWFVILPGQVNSSVNAWNAALNDIDWN